MSIGPKLESQTKAELIRTIKKLQRRITGLEYQVALRDGTLKPLKPVGSAKAAQRLLNPFAEMSR
jgi:hypothetical protein